MVKEAIMKKIMLWGLGVLFVLLLLVVLAIDLFLDDAIRHGVVTYGPRYTKVDIGLKSVKLSLLTGSGTLRGLTVGNPEGFKSPEALKLGTLSLSLKPGSLLSDKIIVRSLHLESPEVTYETDFKTSNLKKIQQNLDQSTGGGKPPPPAPTPSSKVKEEKAAGRKLEVDDLLITGGQVHVSLTALGGQSATVPLAEIHLTNLGQGPEGITAAELAKVILHEIMSKSEQSAGGALTGLGNVVGKNATNALQQIGHGLGGLLKKN